VGSRGVASILTHYLQPISGVDTRYTRAHLMQRPSDRVIIDHGETRGRHVPLTSHTGAVSARSLPASQSDSLDEEPLKAEEHRNDWQNHQARRCHHQVEFNPMRRSEKCETERECV